jgi:hypothetical protein
MSETTRSGPHNGVPADGLAAAAIYLADPLGGEPAVPSPADEAAQREAHVWQRLAELQHRHRRRLGRQLKEVGDCQAAVRGLGARLVLARRGLAAAVRDNDAVHRRVPTPRFAYDELGRALSTVGLVAILSVCILFDYLVDRSALQVLLLPLRVTQTFALFIAVVQTLSAHTVGTLLRRLKESPDPGGLHHERWAMGLLGALVAGSVVGLAAFRGMNGSALFGLVMLATGAATSLSPPWRRTSMPAPGCTPYAQPVAASAGPGTGWRGSAGSCSGPTPGPAWRPRRCRRRPRPSPPRWRRSTARRACASTAASRRG